MHALSLPAGAAFGRVRAAAARGLLVALMLVAGVLISSLATPIDRLPPGGQEIAVVAADFEPAVFPDASTDGVLLVDIPAGSFDAFASDFHGYVVPPVIRLRAGDTIQINNHDTGTHMIFYEVVPPGSSLSMAFDTPGNYVYSSGCAGDPRMNSFTTIIVTA
jgi:FtsP/CotA-like multicopper oxidase with cupredoxin domain